jgi:hypothetical protein
MKRRSGRGWRHRWRWAVVVVLCALVANFAYSAVVVSSAKPSQASGARGVQGALALVVKSRSHLDAISETFSGHVLFQRDADQLTPLASTMKILILEQAAREIADGRLSAGRMVSLSAIASTYLPGTDGGAHPAAIATARTRGWIVRGQISFGHVLYLMIWFSDNAATDTVMRLVDISQLDALARRLGQDPPLAPGGLFASWTDMSGIPADPHRGVAYDREVQALAIKLHDDSRFRAQIASAVRELSIAAQARLTARLAPRGTPAAYARVMSAILTGGSRADQIAKQVLEWPFLLNPQLKRSFAVVAEKGGDLPGVLTVVEGDQLKQHQGYITALFFHGISASANAAIQQADAFDLVPLGIASNGRFRAQAAHALSS